MPTTRDLRRRIKSVKNTSQITKAMQMVSATKMRKAQNQALLSRPYADLLVKALKLVTTDPKKYSHYLLESNGTDKVGMVLFSTDKGLCGALNTSLFRYVISNMLQVTSRESLIFYSVGRKGRDFVARTGKDLKGDFINHEHVTFQQAVDIRNFLLNEFKQKNIGQVFLLYSNFISTLRQEPKMVQLLPINPDVILNEVKDIVSVIASEAKQSNGEIASSQAPRNDDLDFLFEPDIDSLLDYTLTHFLDIQIFKALLETKASEHSARMIAMQNATINAKELVQDLTLTYNQVRQENITRELLEITSAGAALE